MRIPSSFSHLAVVMMLSALCGCAARDAEPRIVPDSGVTAGPRIAEGPMVLNESREGRINRTNRPDLFPGATEVLSPDPACRTFSLRVSAQNISYIDAPAFSAKVTTRFQSMQGQTYHSVNTVSFPMLLGRRMVRLNTDPFPIPDEVLAEATTEQRMVGGVTYTKMELGTVTGVEVILDPGLGWGRILESDDSNNRGDESFQVEYECLFL